MKTNALPTIVGLGGSLRAQSYSHAALQAGLQIAQDLGYATQMLDLRQLDLPMYVPDQAIAQYPHKQIKPVSPSWCKHLAKPMPCFGPRLPTTAA